MTITQRYCLFGLCLIALVMPVNTSGAYNDIHVPLDDESQEIITRGVLNKQITIVPQLNKLNFGLGRYDGVSFYFKKSLYLPDLAVEMAIEKEWSELLYDYEPLMDGSARQADLSNLGKRILRDWPVALLGYDYSFHLIKSGKMNAIAIPTGKIVVSTTLLEALENEEEREALLSLAIAHIEMRHSLRQNQPPVQLDLIYQSILENESKLFLYINDRSLLSDFRKFNGGKTISILVQDKDGIQKFYLLEKFTTEDLWGASLTFGASGKKNGHFIRDAKSIKLELTRPGKAGDRREEPIVEQFMFVRGKLEY